MSKRFYGSVSKLVSILFKKDSQDITVRPNQGTTYTAARDIQLPPGDAAHVLVSADSTQTLTGKTLDGDTNTVQDLALSSLKTVIGDANELVRRDSTGAVVSGPVTASDAGAIAGATQLDVDNIRVDGNTISSTDTNGNVVIDPNGTGEIRAAANVDIRDAASLKLSDSDSSAFIAHKAPAAVTTSVTYTWPEAPATNSYVLASQTDGTLSWVSNASSSSFANDWVTADTATKVITHSLGSKDVIVQIYDKTDDATIIVDSVVRTDTNSITVTASEAPPAAGWRVLILKI